MEQDERWGFEGQDENRSDRRYVDKPRRGIWIPTVAAPPRTRENIQRKGKGPAYAEIGGQKSGEICWIRAPNIPADCGTRRAITCEATFRTVATISFVGKGNEKACISGKYIYIRGKYHYLW